MLILFVLLEFIKIVILFKNVLLDLIQNLSKSLFLKKSGKLSTFETFFKFLLQKNLKISYKELKKQTEFFYEKVFKLIFNPSLF